MIASTTPIRIYGARGPWCAVRYEYTVTIQSMNKQTNADDVQFVLLRFNSPSRKQKKNTVFCVWKNVLPISVPCHTLYVYIVNGRRWWSV